MAAPVFATCAFHDCPVTTDPCYALCMLSTVYYHDTTTESMLYNIFNKESHYRELISLCTPKILMVAYLSKTSCHKTSELSMRTAFSLINTQKEA
jgi:hypothetical protein